MEGLKSLKVGLFDKNIRKHFSGIRANLIEIFTAVLIFVDIPQNYRIVAGSSFVGLLIIIYFIIWFIANKKTYVIIKIESTTVELKFGDIFAQDGLKVIAFNEYFDTQVDDKLISKASLNGQFIINHIEDVKQLDCKIQTDTFLIKNILEKNIHRDEGKTTMYRLGSSILVNDEFILTALSKFNDTNEAELTIQEYVNFLLSFWNEINRLYAQRSVTIPVFGAGITRFKNRAEDIDINDLLRIMLCTFKMSKIKFAYPAKLTILIHDNFINQVNLYELKENQ